ncbi:MAG: fatty acid desaturase [Pseudomonadota bacterium]
MDAPDLAARQGQRTRQTVIGVTLALAIMAAFVGVHVAAVFVIDWSVTPLWVAAALIAVETWLFVGLFIVAHDCMHGSLAPGRPLVNRTFGRIALFLYAAFSYDKLLPEHHRHHRRPGSADDPDFDPDHPTAFLPWFLRFMRHYFGWREFFILGFVMVAYVVILGPPIVNLLVFYALPSVLSAIQLFYFGTYRPHRLGVGEFVDHHNSRTDDFPWLVSLFTCFHFGYHHEHHLSPTTPWWRLPVVRRAQKEVTAAPLSNAR